MSDVTNFSKLKIADLHKIIVGVDYGTTFTGVSYVDSLKRHVDDINVIRTWPGPSREQDESWKTPSRIAYSVENPTIQGEETKWGYMVGPRMKSYTWTKLLLDRSNRTTNGSTEVDIIEGNGFMRLPDFKSEAREVCADFLRGVYNHTKAYLEQRHSPEIINVTTLEFWFTVPAIWSDKAKEETLKAAHAAGFGTRAQDTISMITEPEAAAVATLSALSDDERELKVKVGDGILICDCGGGTVDIVTYKVMQLKPTLRFEELLVGAGEKCGSTYIDREFYKWMSKSFGKAFDKLNPDKKKPGSRFMKDFEGHKRDFGSLSRSDQAFEIELVIPGARDSDIYDAENSIVILNSRIMESFFEPIVGKIKVLLHEQLAQLRKNSDIPIKTIILVGGFGDSPYLNNSLREWCHSQGGISLLCPDNPQASVVKGAALRGLTGLVPEKRLARLNYGMTMQSSFREGIDPEESATTWEWDGSKLCDNRMTWLITKGVAVTPENCLPVEFRMVHKAGESLSFSQHIYTSADNDAPQWYRMESSRQVATIHFTFAEGDLALFPVKKKNLRRKMWELHFSVRVNAFPSKGLLEFRIIGPGGRDMGKATIEYE